MSREIEARLKAAVDAKMKVVTPDRLRPPQPPTDDGLTRTANRWRRPTRWIAPLLAAAAVVAVAVGTTAAVTLADRRHPQVGTPTPTTATTVPTTEPSTATTSAPSSTTTVASPSSPAASTATGAPPPAARHSIDVTFSQATIGVTVPSGWVVSHTNPPSCCDTPPTRCLVHSGTDYSGDADACLLTVTLGHLNPDNPYPSRGQSSCQQWHTTAESNGPVQGRIAEYRKFEDPCSGAIYEQWTIMSSPMIAFWHPVSSQSSAASAKQIVDSAALPAEVDARRQVDEGYLRGMTKHADGYHVTIDRVVVNLDGSVINLNQATYEYRLAGGLAVTGDSPCSGCTTMDEVYQQYAKGPHPADGSKPVDGAFVRLTSNYAPNIDRGYALELELIRPFQS